MIKAITVGTAAYTPRSALSVTPVDRRPFLSNIRIDYGPAGLLAHFFIAADAVFAAQGIALQFASFQELEQVNAANRDSWKPLNPTFVPSSGLMDNDSAFALLGFSEKGDVVTSVACKRFDWATSDFKIEAESMRFLYADPARMAPAGAGCRVTAPSAAQIAGCVGYVGAAWLHPSARKRQLAAVQARLMRAVALGRWRIDLAFGISSLELIAKGYSNRTGWKHVEPGVSFANLDSCPPQAGLVSMTAKEVIEDLQSFLRELRTVGQDRGQLGCAEDTSFAGNIERENEPRVAQRHSPA
jgi:hypothetical protein